MATLTVQGVEVPVLEDADVRSIELGMHAEAHDGTPRRYLGREKQRALLSTGPLEEAVARGLVAIVEGHGDSWAKDTDAWSDKGAPVVAGITSWLTSAPGMPHGVGMDVSSSSAILNDELPAEWTVHGWRSTGASIAAQHVLGTSEGRWWVDGVEVADPGWVTVSGTNLHVTQGVWAHVRLLPVVLPAGWAWGIRDSEADLQPQGVPRVACELSAWGRALICVGEVGEVAHRDGLVSLTIALEEL